MTSAKIIQIIVVLIIIFNISRICALGKNYITADNKRYYIEEDQKYTWFDALNECRQRNMNLVAIETSSKSKEINTLIMETFGRTVVLWIGGIMIRDNDVRNYKWIATDQQFNYTYWKGNNPDFTNSNEYCIEIGWGPNMEWNDDNCGNKYGYICENNESEDLKQNNTQVLENLQEMTNSVDILHQELQDHDQLKDKLRLNIIEREHLQQELMKTQQQQEELKEQLQQIMENEVEKEDVLVENLQTDTKELQKFLQILQKQKMNLEEILQKRQNLQTKKENEDNEENRWKNSKYRENFYQFIILNR